MKKLLTTGLLLAGIALIAVLVWWRSHTAAANRSGGRAPISVEITHVRKGPAPFGFTAVGQVASPHSVAIRPQVTGTLQELYFQEGTDVAAGARLARIDPTPYRAAVDQARGNLERDRAAAGSARSALKRLLPLAEKDYATPQELERARGDLAQAEALVQADQAAVEHAQVDLDHTLIVSPIKGRAGALSVKPGNVVAPTDITALVTINQLQPMEIAFSAPQSRLAAIRDAMAKGPVPVTIATEDGEDLDQGRLSFVDNAVDSITGTVKLKAESPNAQQALWPGTFVTVKITLAVQADALLVPESAVQAGAEGPYVFKVSSDNKVSLANVTVDRQAGADVVVTKGVAENDAIVAKAPRNLLPGMSVTTGGGQAPADGAPRHESGGAPQDKPS